MPISFPPGSGGGGGSSAWGDITGDLEDQTDLNDTLADKLAASGQAADVDPAGTAIASALSGKASSSHTHAYDDLTGKPTLGTAAALNVPASGNAASGEVVKGNDARLSDSRTPTSHSTSHKSGGGDAIKLDELAAPTDVTTLNATTGQHGLLPKLGGGTTNFLRADGSWAAPSGSASLPAWDDVAFVNADHGNNTTGTIGDPALPYATAQAAVDDGATILHVIGSVGGITASGALTLHLIGMGRDLSVVGNIITGGNLILTGNGAENISVATVNNNESVHGTNGANGANGGSTGATGDSGQSGGSGFAVSARNIYFTGTIFSTGGNGGDGGDGGAGDSETAGGAGGAGGEGGVGGDITLEECNFLSVFSSGGNGGSGGDEGSNGGAGGGTGGNGGNTGNGGPVTILRSLQRAGGTRSTPAGLTVGSGGANAGVPGNLGTNGTTAIRGSDVQTGSNTTDTVVGSIVNDSFVAS